MPARASRTSAFLAALVAVAVWAEACGGPGDGDDGPIPIDAQGNIDYGKINGEVRVDGSSTVFPISAAVAEEFSRDAGKVKVPVGSSGTGGGFQKFCRGEIDVADASRPMNQTEKDACMAQGIPADDIVELEIAIDALTVVVNPRNTWATCLTTAQLTNAFQNGGARKWSDIDPGWPAESITFYYPGADSGTFDYFKEATKTRGEANNEPAHRSDGTASEDDNLLVKGIEGDKNAIGYFGFAYYLNEGQDLKPLQIDGGNGCLAPTFENAIEGKYKPLSRPLFIYTSRSALREKNAVLGFIDYYLNNTTQLSREEGYISLPDDILQAQKAKIAEFLP